MASAPEYLNDNAFIRHMHEYMTLQRKTNPEKNHWSYEEMNRVYARFKAGQLPSQQPGYSWTVGEPWQSESGAWIIGGRPTDSGTSDPAAAPTEDPWSKPPPTSTPPPAPAAPPNGAAPMSDPNNPYDISSQVAGIMGGMGSPTPGQRGNTGYAPGGGVNRGFGAGGMSSPGNYGPQQGSPGQGGGGQFGNQNPFGGKQNPYNKKKNMWGY